MTESPWASCELCPRRCGVNRAGAKGFCGEGAELRIASASIHRGEEPPITGEGGSGALFVTGCTLGCAFCQNYQISREGMGRSVSTGEFAEICLALASRGVENINIVTGTHAAPALADGLAAARKQGLVLPVLWNSSGYETGAALERVSNFVDVYLPDLKTLDPEIARRWFHAADYPQKADRALRAMLDARGELRYDGRGVLVSGVIIRHLVIPGELYATRDVIRWFARNARGRALFSLMTQYTPPKAPSGENGRDAPPDRHLNQNEYDALLSWLDEYGVDDGFLQEPVRNSLWLPDFNRVNPFSSTLSVPVWHWKTGFAVS